MTREKARQVLDALLALYPDAGPELDFSNPFETLIATILAAQCTDKRVNKVTENLFPAYPDAFAMARLTPEELEPWIKECGLFHAKARNIVAACKALAEQYDGVVPADRKQLMALPGVGQKTAGVVLMAAFGDPQIPVDTHVFRLSRRIGFSGADTPEKVEVDLQNLIDRDEWIRGHHLLIWHGRRMCHARGPKCDSCPLNGGLCEKNFMD